MGMFEDDDENGLPISGNGTFGLPNLNKHLPKYQCHSCEQPDCSEETICINAYQVSLLHIIIENLLTSFYLLTISVGNLVFAISLGLNPFLRVVQQMQNKFCFTATLCHLMEMEKFNRKAVLMP